MYVIMEHRKETQGKRAENLEIQAEPLSLSLGFLDEKRC